MYKKIFFLTLFLSNVVHASYPGKKSNFDFFLIDTVREFGESRVYLDAGYSYGFTPQVAIGLAVHGFVSSGMGTSLLGTYNFTGSKDHFYVRGRLFFSSGLGLGVGYHINFGSNFGISLGVEARHFDSTDHVGADVALSYGF